MTNYCGVIQTDKTKKNLNCYKRNYVDFTDGLTTDCNIRTVMVFKFTCDLEWSINLLPVD